jgi:uncharacterized small protein (DUF1192 family)
MPLLPDHFKALRVLGILAIAVFAVVFATTDKPLMKMATLFGIKVNLSEPKNPEQIAIDHLTTRVAQHTDVIAQFNTLITSFGETVEELKNAFANNDSKVSELEGRVEQMVAEINKLKAQRVTSKPKHIVAPKAPPKPPIVIALVSIRSQGGNAWASLREGLESSPLMAIGDEWHSVKLVSVDTNNKSVQLLINGSVTTVNL